MLGVAEETLAVSTCSEVRCSDLYIEARTMKLTNTQGNFHRPSRVPSIIITTFGTWTLPQGNGRAWRARAKALQREVAIA